MSLHINAIRKWVCAQKLPFEKFEDKKSQEILILSLPIHKHANQLFRDASETIEPTFHERMHRS